ncbi:hypothetical protein [Clostridium sp. D53t1_180928_C8]|uniref:hypothetical protein n=1 Tax=Clostridium sp. D53t1_180928_C8 TaxID=2787101 RepID=UPI0018AC1FD8|nr:hypothetical protein [Clostridium sp. D53t1_180928_C8]
MRKSLFILIVITTIFCIPINTSAYQPYKSAVYKQGVYEIGELNKYSISFELLTDNKTYVLLVDNNNQLLSYLRLPYKQKINLSNLGDTATIAIIGPGEVAIVYEKK